MRGGPLVFAALLLLATAAGAAAAGSNGAIVMVTHGQGDDPFWRDLERGARDAAALTGVELTIERIAPFDAGAMNRRLTAVAGKPEDVLGLVVSAPSPEAVAGGLRLAFTNGLPVVTINSGPDVASRVRAELRPGATRSHDPPLPATVHVGQHEEIAGCRVGAYLRRVLGAHSALCLVHERGNEALDARCRGLAHGLGGRAQRLEVDRDDVVARVEAAAAAAPQPEAIVALGPTTSHPLLEPLRDDPTRFGGLPLVAFDPTEALERALEAEHVLLTVDQQPYLQGYLPVVLLTNAGRTSSVELPVANIWTGPQLIDAHGPVDGTTGSECAFALN